MDRIFVNFLNMVHAGGRCGSCRRRNPLSLSLLSLLLAAVLLAAALAGCSREEEQSTLSGTSGKDGTEGFSYLDRLKMLTFVDEEPNTVDPQCTGGYYTVALNAFDRLVEIRSEEDGSSSIVPSLAKSWEISEDGTVYTFHLEENVRFHNGDLLTASDVKYTFSRMLTHPYSRARDIADEILGADALMDGTAETLEGVRVLDNLTFEVELSQPISSFLACLSTPAASILNERSTESAGAWFGRMPAMTVGTGPFVFRLWEEGVRLVLEANPNCWAGPPACDGLDIRIVKDPEAERLLFEKGELDILDLDNMGEDKEYFIHGDVYQERLRQGLRVGISYIALNESFGPLKDVRVRKALQLALDRRILLDAVYSGRGKLENGIFPHGLIGYNPDLPEIPYDPERAQKLIKEAGYSGGIELPVVMVSDSTGTVSDLLDLIRDMWSRIGVTISVEEMDEDSFIEKRSKGEIAVYTATWSADYNDPENFIYTFFGTESNTKGRSLCYSRKEIMERIQNARAIVDEDERIREYQELEKIIVQDDAAWIPLYCRQHYFVVGERVREFNVSWNGWSSNNYRNVSLE